MHTIETYVRDALFAIFDLLFPNKRGCRLAYVELDVAAPATAIMLLRKSLYKCQFSREHQRGLVF